MAGVQFDSQVSNVILDRAVNAPLPLLLKTKYLLGLMFARFERYSFHIMIQFLLLLFYFLIYFPRHVLPFKSYLPERLPFRPFGSPFPRTWTVRHENSHAFRRCYRFVSLCFVTPTRITTRSIPSVIVPSAPIHRTVPKGGLGGVSHPPKKNTSRQSDLFHYSLEGPNFT
jgi:hypothetical protein